MTDLDGITRILGNLSNNIYLVESGDELVVVDPGMPSDIRRLVDRIKSLGRSPKEVTAIVLTHFHVDHAGSARALKQMSSASVYLHADDAPEPLRSIAAAIRDREGCPVLHICGDSTHLLGGMAASGVDGLSLDHPVDLSNAMEAVPESMLVIGNVDPVGVMMEAEPAAVMEVARSLIERFGGKQNFVLGTGCDLPIETPLENIDALFAAAK